MYTGNKAVPAAGLFFQSRSVQYRIKGVVVYGSYYIGGNKLINWWPVWECVHYTFSVLEAKQISEISSLHTKLHWDVEQLLLRGRIVSSRLNTIGHLMFLYHSRWMFIIMLLYYRKIDGFSLFTNDLQPLLSTPNQPTKTNTHSHILCSHLFTIDERKTNTSTLATTGTVSNRSDSTALIKG